MSTTVEKQVRTPVSPRLRMEVFKRDGFTCQYCGRKTPEVILEADHIIPVAEGGSSDIENLVTACWECNRGKGAGLLDDRAPVADMHDQAVHMAEREMQLAEYNAIKQRVLERENRDMAVLDDYWQQLAGQPTSTKPYDNVLRSALKRLPATDIQEAMNIAFSGDRSPYSAARYLSGILKNWRDEAVEATDAKGDLPDSILSVAAHLEAAPEYVSFLLKHGGEREAEVSQAVLVEMAMCLGHLEAALRHFYRPGRMPGEITINLFQIQGDLPKEAERIATASQMDGQDAACENARHCIRRMRDLLDRATNRRFAYKDEA